MPDPKRPCVTIERKGEHHYEVCYWQPRKREPTNRLEVAATPPIGEQVAITTANEWSKRFNCPLVTVSQESTQ